jgi:cobalt/nickel transport system ATP-binding protein
MSCVVDASDLRFRYDGGREALRGVNLHVGAGENVAILGPNGSGKTTFLLHLNGILRGQGDLMVCHMKIEPATLPALRRKVGFLFQDPDDQLFRPTVLDDVAFGPRQAGLAPAEAEARARRALAEVGFREGTDRPPHQLSGGEKQRVALAGLLASEPDVLLLDEPTTHLDPPGRRALLDLLRRLPQAKLVVTHDSAFARALCPRAIFFDAGRVVADGPTAEIVTRFGWEI